MDQVTALWLIRLIVDLLFIGGLALGLLRYMRRRLRATGQQMDHFAEGAQAREGQIGALDTRVGRLEAGQTAMHAEQVAQRELLNRISLRLARQTNLLEEIVPTVRKLNTESIAEQVVAGMFAARAQGQQLFFGPVAGGPRSTAIGGDVRESAVVPGDHNQIGGPP